MNTHPYAPVTAHSFAGQAAGYSTHLTPAEIARGLRELADRFEKRTITLESLQVSSALNAKSVVVTVVSVAFVERWIQDAFRREP